MRMNKVLCALYTEEVGEGEKKLCSENKKKLGNISF